MQHVWFLFKLLEVFLGGLCLAYHIISLDDREPMPHVVFYCGTFFGYTLISFFGTIGILLGRGPKPFMEAITNALGAVMFTLASILAMYHAENDFHLMYLSDFEEPLHNYFRNCKNQSIASLAGAFLYLLHSIYAFDVVCVTKRRTIIFEDENEEVRQPIRLFFISETVQIYLERYSWFRRYSVGDLSKTSDFHISSLRGHSSHKKSRGSSHSLAASGRSRINVTRSRINFADAPTATDNHLSGGYCAGETQPMEMIEIV